MFNDSDLRRFSFLVHFSMAMLLGVGLIALGIFIANRNESTNQLIVSTQAELRTMESQLDKQHQAIVTILGAVKSNTRDIEETKAAVGQDKP